MILAIALLAVAPDPFPAPRVPTGVLRISCRQGECHWQQIRRIDEVRARRGEVLRKLTSRSGVSTHLGERIPARYSPRLRIDWAAAPRIEYVLCSKQRPATIFASGGQFVVTRLNLADLGGYEYAAATLYMQACHNIAPGRWREKQAPGMGYRAARSRQDRYRTLNEALATLR